MPSGVEELRTSAALGRNIASLLDPEVELRGVTADAAVQFLGLSLMSLRLTELRLNQHAT